jgi:hypothetical protein
MHRWSYRAAALAVAGALVLAAAPAVRAEGWGTIKGQVVWGGGDVPRPIQLNVDKDKEHCLSKGPILKEEYVVNPSNKGVRWTIVYLTSADGFAKDVPVHPKLKEIKDKVVTIDQPCCRFEPHALAMREGQTLVVKNSAPISHNVNIQGGAKGPNLNQILPPGAQLKQEDIVARPLPISVSCNIHGWMAAKVFVLKNPYFAVTDENGKFEIKDVPAGEYRLVAWQEGMGWVLGDKAPNKMGKKITVKDGETTELDKVPVKPSQD